MTNEISHHPLEAQLREMTAARVALGRSGSGWPTAASLSFSLDHARAREAVWSAMDQNALQAAFADWTVETVSSAAADRATYIRRPDLGRILAPDTDLSNFPKNEIVIVVADGLSATAVNENAAHVVRALQKHLSHPAPVVLVENGRVAIGDEIGAATKARATNVLIGERPGLSAADSLGAYITWAPEAGLPDSRRNCISNIRTGGLAPEVAAENIAWLLQHMERMSISGVQLETDSVKTLE
jgi:ethanolamine ammonia-lyase small subunit